MTFNNNSSMVRFIKEESTIEDVIAADTKELEEVNGSFQAIADRMDYLIEQINANHDLTKLSTPYLLSGEENIEVIDVLYTRGFQTCPFSECDGKPLSSSDYVIRNKKSGVTLYINETTSHLAKEHNLLEKDNKYRISAKIFYEHFMPNQE